jgi:hypothetical protein
MHFTIVQKPIPMLVLENNRRQNLDVPNPFTLKKQNVRKFNYIKNCEVSGGHSHEMRPSLKDNLVSAQKLLFPRCWCSNVENWMFYCAD